MLLNATYSLSLSKLIRLKAEGGIVHRNETLYLLTEISPNCNFFNDVLVINFHFILILSNAIFQFLLINILFLNISTLAYIWGQHFKTFLSVIYESL